MSINVKKWGMMILCCAVVGFISASSSLTAAPSQGVSSSSVSTNKSSSTGIRFSFKDIPDTCQDGPYMIAERGKCVQIPPISGLLGDRFPIPANRIITLYDKPAEDGKPAGKKLISAQLPKDMGKNVIGVIASGRAGDYDLFFIDEKDVKKGTVLLRNLTPEALRIQITDHKAIDLAPGQSETFSPDGKEAGKGVYPAKLYCKDKDGKWYVTRQMAFSVRKDIAEIALIIWNASIKRPDFQKISVSSFAP